MKKQVKKHEKQAKKHETVRNINKMIDKNANFELFINYFIINKAN
jgi:hypothetical protein